jgi:hypothetical protein
MSVLEIVRIVVRYDVCHLQKLIEEMLRAGLLQSTEAAHAFWLSQISIVQS